MRRNTTAKTCTERQIKLKPKDTILSATALAACRKGVHIVTGGKESRQHGPLSKRANEYLFALASFRSHDQHFIGLGPTYRQRLCIASIVIRNASPKVLAREGDGGGGGEGGVRGGQSWAGRDESRRHKSLTLAQKTFLYVAWQSPFNSGMTRALVELL